MSDAFTAAVNNSRIPKLVCDVYEREMTYFRTTGKLPENRKTAAKGLRKGLIAHLGHRVTGLLSSFPSDLVSAHSNALRDYYERRLSYDQLHYCILRSWKDSDINISSLQQASN